MVKYEVMEIEKNTFAINDETNIFYEQQQALKNIFERLDMSKIAFVGGIADYLNLRRYYEMPVNDIDIIYENEDDLLPIKEQYGIIKYCTKFYNMDVGEVLVSECFVNSKKIHMDFYKRNFSKIKLTQSPLLGKMVSHATFSEMKDFHNKQIPEVTSKTAGEKYEWRRLYKHSRKASLYNNVSYLEEKNLIETLKKSS